MRRSFFSAFFSILLLVLIPCLVFAAPITGEYVETRNADVYTGYCFANSEAGLVGDTAILGWHIRAGSWHGVALDGLSVAVVVRAQATLGDPYSHPFPAHAILIVDEQAALEQRAALADFARSAGGELTAHILRTEAAPVEVAVTQHGNAFLRAGYDVDVRTRALNQNDHLCGNEETYYPPLTALVHARPAVALTDEYAGGELGVRWELHGKRSAFTGTFEMDGSSGGASAR